MRNEWKRIWGHPKRCILLFLLSFFNLFMFFLGEAGGIQISDWTDMVRHSCVTKEYVESCREMEWKEAKDWLRAEQDRLATVSLWAGGYLEGEVTREMVEEWLAEYPDLLGMIDETVPFRLEISWYGEMLGTIEAELQYLIDYPSYLEQIQEQYRSQSKNSLLMQTGPFFERNLEKTAGEFARLQDVKLSFGHNKGAVSWLQFRLTDYVYLAVLFIVVFAFLEERRRGLWDMIRSTMEGRKGLGVARFGVLGIFCLLYTFVLYGGNLVAALALYGGWEDLGRSIQSLTLFETYPVPISVGQWLLVFFICKIVLGILIGLVVWAVLGWIRHIQLSMLILIGIFVLEYSLYAWIPPQSSLNIFKYWNLFSCIHTTELFMQYVNLNLAGWPVNIRELFLWSVPILFVSLAGLVSYVQCKQYPAGGSNLIEHIEYRVQSGLDQIRIRIGKGGMEIYKLLFLEGGLLFLAAAGILSGNLKYNETIHPQGKGLYYEEYLTDAEGPIDESIQQYLDYAKEQAQDLPLAMEGVMQLEERIYQLQERAQEQGFVPWLINQEYFEGFWGSKAKSLQRQNALWALLLILCLSSGMVAYERQEGVTGLLRSLPKGRKELYRIKVSVHLFIAILIWSIINGRELWELCTTEAFRWDVLGAMVQNLDFLQDFPVQISIGAYMMILYGVRLVMLLCVTMIASFVGSQMSGLQGAYMMNFLILGVPALLFAMSIESVKYLTVLSPLSGNELLFSLGKNGEFGLVGICLAMGIGAFVLMRRRWLLDDGKGLF